jgi:TolB-like protein/class 3 adenylate cyclase/Flp pilus assembly protein TadD
MSQTRRLAAIFAADVVGYSRLMGTDEEGTHERLKAHLLHVVDPKIREHRGRIVKNTGDGMLVEFGSVVGAVRCAVEIQRAMIDRNTDTLEDKRISFRIGINLGDVIAEPEDIFGDSVNIASRLEALAEPGGVFVSNTVYDHVRDRLPFFFEDLGEQQVKNIARPIRIFAISAATVGSLSPVPRPAEAILLGTPSNASRLSIVVLPFANLSNDPEQEYFADGITYDLTTDLSRISGSFVIARNTAFTYKGRSVEVKQLGRELGVRYALEGSVRRTGEEVRVNVQLVDTETGSPIWADRFATDRSDLGKAQDAITARLARTLHLELVGDAGRRIEREGILNPDARDLVMRGWAWCYRPYSASNRRVALQAFEKALEIDPGSFDARVGVATVLVGNVIDGWSKSLRQDQERAERLLLEAFEQNASSSMAHYTMGTLRRAQMRLKEARIELERAITLDQNNARAHYHLGQTFIFMGQPEAAIRHIENAIRLNPYDPNIAALYWGLGASHLFLGNIDESVDFLRKGCTANPRLFFIHLFLAGALGIRDDIEEAKAALDEAIKIMPGIRSIRRWRGYAAATKNPEYWSLLEKTVNFGLRRAGFPDR